jgi:hypothetical protein
MKEKIEDLKGKDYYLTPLILKISESPDSVDSLSFFIFLKYFFNSLFFAPA